jgi:glycosyltransferase involved in cell wall biosynthesis
VKILSVAYPFAPVTADPAGGAEQVLAALDRALVAAGHGSIVVAAEGSEVAGPLWSVPAVSGPIDDAARVRTHAATRSAIDAAVNAEQPDLLHLHGIDFADYLPAAGPPAMVTLHLPLDWYPPPAFDRAATFVPVSASQAARAPGLKLAPPIANGVDLDRFRPAAGKGDFALILGRVAPEKGFHDAIAAARAADVPLIAAGELYPYPAHQAYFADRVAPMLDARRRFVGPVAGAEKARLLADARCLLVPSTAPETSSLVAMEALASGTPVIAYRAGALPDIVEHGATGFLVDGVAEMTAAIGRADAIDPAACRAAAERRFGAGRMIADYLALYARLAA